MTRSQTLLALLALCMIAGAPPAFAQQTAPAERAIAPGSAASGAAPAPASAAPPSPPAAASPSTDRADDDDNDDRSRRTPDAVRIGQDYSLGAGETIRQAVVILGDGTIAGHVEKDVVVIMGKARFADTAVVTGDVVVIAGAASIEPGATLGKDLVVVGGAIETPAGFSPGGQQVIVGANMFGRELVALVPWFSRGLLWGRPIVPDLPWVWGFVAFFLIVSLAVNALFDGPVHAAADALREKPLTTFGSGLLVLLLIGPAIVVLALSIVGLALIPVAVCALLAVWVLGKVAVTRWLGGSIAGDAPGERVRALRALVIGFAVLCLAYMIPVLGFVTWAITGVAGLGAATLTLIDSYRREHPAAAASVPPPIPRYGVPVTAPGPQMATAFPESPAVVSPAVAAGDRHSGEAARAANMVPGASGAIAFPHAFLRERLAAFALDFILVMLAVQILDVRRGGRMFFLSLLVYHVALWTWKQTTVGGIICQLRVVRVDGSRLTFADALVRALSSIFSVAVLALGVLSIMRDPERQAWHDKIAGTFVVKVPRGFPV